MDLVALLKAAEDGHGVLDRGLLGEHGLETPLQGGVLLDVLAVFVQGRRADDVELAPGEGRLEEVRGVHRALGRPRADEGVKLVDEQDHAPLALLDLLDHGLEPLLELAAELASRHEGAEVEGEEPLPLQAVRDVPGDDPPGEALDDGRLSDAGFADEDGVVLRSPREDLHDPPDLLVPADHRVELFLAGEGRQVSAEFVENLVLALGVLVGHPLVPAYRLEGGEDAVLRHTGAFEQGAGIPVVVQKGKEDVLGRDVLVLEGGRFPLGLGQDLAGLGREVEGGRRAVDLGQLPEEFVHVGLEFEAGNAETVEEGRYDAVVLLEQGLEYVGELDLAVIELLGDAARFLNGFLGFDGEGFVIHLL